MKRIYLAAGALLLGTSAFAWAPSSQPVAHSDKELTAAVDPGAKAPSTMLVAKSNDLPKVDESVVKGEAASASWIADDQTLAETTPQPAAGNYPPCSPGPGDDHCIQLYERGVRAQLASWEQPTGTLADNSATNAVGGPYEPVADTTLASEMGGASTPADMSKYTGTGGPEETADDAALAMNGDGAVDAGLGETTTDEGGAASVYTGVGGPLEEVDGATAATSYPPCRPGPGDDHCIQLYERGVTGR
jgi:hypothetical protein